MSLIEELKASAAAIVDPDIQKYIDSVNPTKEPLLCENDDRFSMISFVKDSIVELYREEQKTFWVASEHSMTDDKIHYENATPAEKHLIRTALEYFAASDGIINENLIVRFLTEITNPQSRSFYSFQLMMENVHSEAYGIMLGIFPTAGQELGKVIFKPGMIKEKARWLFKYMSNPDPSHYMNDKRSLGIRLIAYACGEMIGFSTSFLVIFWFKARGKFPGVAYFNELIQRDEGLHGRGSFAHYHLFKHRVPEEIAHRIIKESVELECMFFKQMLPEDIFNLRYDDVVEYIHFNANNVSSNLGYAIIYPGAKQPFGFMEQQGLWTKSNMHEKQSSNYRTAISVKPEENEFCMKFDEAE
jgi:ribonucleotide reductase beta subunit family protein with ferritin-like domain